MLYLKETGSRQPNQQYRETVSSGYWYGLKGKNRGGWQVSSRGETRKVGLHGKMKKSWSSRATKGDDVETTVADK